MTSLQVLAPKAVERMFACEHRSKGVRFQPAGARFDIGTEICGQHALLRQEALETAVWEKVGQISFEDHAVKSREYAYNGILVYTQDCIHGLPVAQWLVVNPGAPLRDVRTDDSLTMIR
jgi:hypothetical protein